jgi:hypothetical protein
MNTIEGKTAPEQEFIRLYLKELDRKPQADVVSEPDLRKHLAGLIDKVDNSLPLFACLGIGIDRSSLLDFAEGLESLLFSHASELLHNVFSCLPSRIVGYYSVPAVTVSDCFRPESKSRLW